MKRKSKQTKQININLEAWESVRNQPLFLKKISHNITLRALLTGEEGVSYMNKFYGPGLRYFEVLNGAGKDFVLLAKHSCKLNVVTGQVEFDNED